MDSCALRRELHAIKQRHAEFEIIGPPEMRDFAPNARYFSPEFQGDDEHGDAPLQGAAA